MLPTLKKALNVLIVYLNRDYSFQHLQSEKGCGLQLVSATAMELHINALLGKQAQSLARWSEGWEGRGARTPTLGESGGIVQHFPPLLLPFL